MRDWVSIDHQVEHQTGLAGEVSSCGPGIDQDVAIWVTPAAGAAQSRGYRGEYLPWQERRIRYFHENIDRYLAHGAPASSGDRSRSGDRRAGRPVRPGRRRACGPTPTSADYGIVVCRVAGELHAIEDNCSHADTPLSEGRLRGFNLVCPLHGASFDVRDGSHSGPPAWEGVPCHRLHGEPTEVSVEVAPISDDDPDDNRDVGGRFLTR